MANDRSNSQATLDDLLAPAKQHARDAEEHEAAETSARRRKIISSARCADAIVVAKEDAKSQGLRPTNDDIAESMGWTTRAVEQLMSWRRKNPGNPEVVTSGPWDDGRSQTDKNAAARYSTARRVLLHEEDIIVDAALHDNRQARRIIRKLQKGLEAKKPPRPKEPPPPPKDHLFIPLRDTIVMGDHVLFVGDSANAYFKHYLLSHIGVSQEGYEDPYPIESGIVVVTDPPYGQNQPGVPGDGSADHNGVYNMLKPRGGFSFCAFRPPLFSEAEEGIKRAHGVPVHYLAMRTQGAMGQGPDGRLHNLLQSIIYWERRGEKPWIKGRSAFSVLEADEQAREEMRVMREQHTTPKPVNVMEKLIELVTDEGDFVLDPFTGSGSTLIACDRLKRRFIGFEGNGITDVDRKKWEPHPYAEVAVQRWENEPGNKGKAVVHRAKADPPTMLFEELVAKGRWHEDKRWPDEGPHTLAAALINHRLAGADRTKP